MLVQPQMGNARLYRGIKIGWPHLQDPVHPRNIERDSAPQCHDMTLQAGTRTEGNDRYLMTRTDLDDLAHLFGRLRESDCIRR